MQAVKAYYDEGKFIPFKSIEIPKGSHAIVTILDFPITDEVKNTNNTSNLQIEAMRLFRDEMHQEALSSTHNKAEKKPRALMFGYLRGEYTISNDFDAPLDDFKEYM